MSETRLAIMTPHGRGAVGTIVLDGPCAFDLFAQVFRLPSGSPLNRETFPNDRPVFGFLSLGTGNLQEGTVVHRVGDRRIELHVHGGDSICQAVVQTFRDLGASIRTWNDPSFYSDSVADQVERLLPCTLTEKTAAILLRQADGRLARAMQRLSQKKAKSHASPEELKKLAAARFLGEHLTKPFRVLILGPVNAGKSSLINALVGFNRAVVDSTPGTTRDPVSAMTAIDGWPVQFIDTAGLNSTPDELEAQGIAMALSSRKDADLILFVFDVTRDSSFCDPANHGLVDCKKLLENNASLPPRYLTGHTPDSVQPQSLTVLNKTDLPQSLWHPEWLNSDRIDLRVSAKSGNGIDLLLNTIITALLPLGEDFEAIPFGIFSDILFR